MRATAVCIFALVLAYASATSQLVQKVLREEPRVADLTAKLSMKKKIAQNKANEASMKPVLANKYKTCKQNSDCEGSQECVNYVPKLTALTGNDKNTFGTIHAQVKAQDKRCKEVFFPELKIEGPHQLVALESKVKKISVKLTETFTKINKTGLTLSRPPFYENIDEYVMKMTQSYNKMVKPVKVGNKTVPGVRSTEVSGGLDMNTFLLISLLDKDGSSSSLSDLLPIILMSQGGSGMGGDLLSNPLLLMSLLDDDDSSSSSDLLLIMTLMNGGGLGGSTDLLGSPLLLMTLLKDDSSSMSDLLPILLLSGGLGGGATGGADLMSNPILLLLLLDDDSNSSLSSLLPLILLGSMDASGSAGAGGMNSILPLLLLLDDNSTDISDLLLIMMVSGGGLGGAGGAAGDLNSLLPILLLGDGLGGGMDDSKDLLLLSMLSGGGAGGAGGAGGLESILPFLLLSDSSILNGSDSLTLVLLLSGGLGGGAAAGGAAPDMNMLLPLLLGGSMNGSNDLLLLMMLGGMGGAAGGAGGMESMLPLLLMGSNGTMDTTTLVLVMMMSQAQPGTVSPIDGSTGLTVAPQSNLNSILPLLLLSGDGLGGGDDTLSMILLLSMLSQGAPSAGLVGK